MLSRYRDINKIIEYIEIKNIEENGPKSKWGKY